MDRTERIRHAEKRMTRKEILEKKKSIEKRIKDASSVKDHLDSFPHLRFYSRDGLQVRLESGLGNRLALCTKKYIQILLKVNMEAAYGHEWAEEEKIKKREIVAEQARYIFVHEILNDGACNIDELKDKEKLFDRNGPIVGFLHYRFTVEEEVPVVYVYELQLEPRVQGKGIGNFLMHLIEHIACQSGMSAVMLTVQKANRLAMDFYTKKLKYSVSAISPSRVDTLLGLQKSYEILCKTFDHEAGEALV